jgi:hypothetical protein
MRLEKIGLYTSGIRTKVYDVEIKELIGTFESRNDAAKFTGVSLSHIADHVRSKRKVFSRKLNKKITFR